MKCEYCGRENPQYILTRYAEDRIVLTCPNCAQFFNTCRLCSHAQFCEFETNPSPLPKQVQQTIRQGNMIAQTVVRNPDRIKAFCFECPCWNTENQCCGREFGTCGRYDEYVPLGPSPN